MKNNINTLCQDRNENTHKERVYSGKELILIEKSIVQFCSKCGTEKV